MATSMLPDTSNNNPITSSDSTNHSNVNQSNNDNNAIPIPSIPAGMDPTYYALSLLRRRRLEECIAISTHYLSEFNERIQQQQLQSQSQQSQVQSENPFSHQQQLQQQQQGVGGVDESLWFIQTKALTMQNWFDELDVDDDGVDELLLEGEQTIVSTAPRPGTSLQRQTTSNTIAGSSLGNKPPTSTSTTTQRGTARPISSRYGFARPGTQRTSNNNNNNNNITSRAGTGFMRPLTNRLMRIGTASLQAVPGGPHLDVQKINLEKYARGKPILARLLCDYLLHVEHRPKMVLELGSFALDHNNSNHLEENEEQLQLKQKQQIDKLNKGDWWWASRVGQACYRLGLLREAEHQFKSALAIQENVADAIRLAKVFAKMDQPLTALEVLTEASDKNPMDHHLLLGMARLYDQLHDAEKSCQLYRRVLQLDSSNVEAIACIAAYLFYENHQPELALRLYRRLLQMGVQTTELWNNLGLCCFYSSQYDIALSCLQRALASAADDIQLSNIWYNIGHIGIGTGDLTLAFRAFKISIGANPQHAEALNNLAILKIRMGLTEQAENDLAMAIAVEPEQHESLYNAALLAFRAGNFERAYKLLNQSLQVCPDHPESVVLQSTLRSLLAAL